jgi:lipid-A-disaccharide synthase
MQPDAAAARRRLGLPLRPTVVAVLPGSRSAEVELLGPAFCEAAAALQRHDASLRIALPAADAALLAALGPMLARAGADLDRTVLLQGRAHDVLEAADAVLVAGGTATLEAMLFKRPMVIAYRVPRLTEWITLRKAIIPYFGLPNVLCARYCVPEFLQEAVTGPALTRALLRLLDDDGERMRLHEEFDRQHEALRRDTAGLFAQAVAQAAEEARR